MLYSFEISSEHFTEFKNFSNYIGDQFHLQSIGEQDEIKFLSNITTTVRKIRTYDFGEKIEKIIYGLGKKNKEFEFTLDKYNINLFFFFFC